MKIYLDLLPTQKKEEIKRKKIFAAILRQEALFLFPVIAFILILINIYYVLYLQRNSSIVANANKQSQEKYQQLSMYEEKFKEINELDQKIIKIQTGHMYWQQPLKELSKVMPEGVYVSDVSTKDYAMFLVGKARTREDLLNFKNNLEAIECFKEINVPLSNLVTKNDVVFQIDLKVNEECLKKEINL